MKFTTRTAALLLSFSLLCTGLTGCGQDASQSSSASAAAASSGSAAASADAQISFSTEPEASAGAAEDSAAEEIPAFTKEYDIPDIDTSVAWDEECTISVFAMDTLMDMKAYGAGAQEALTVISNALNELDQTLSVTSEDSEIYAVNHAAGKAVAVSDTTRYLLRRAVALGDTTGNALDISLYPVLSAWGFTTESYQIPTESELAGLLKLVDDNQIEIDDTAGTVTVPEGMEIDLGSVVKGYAGDEAVSILQQCGVTSALLNLGGSTIRVLGSKLDGADWKVAIQDPNDTASYAGILAVSDCAVDTSGGYERYFTGDDGTVYWHILDPSTGCPAKSGLISATIISPDSFTGDGLSTACFVMGLQQTIDYWRENGGFEFVLITEDEEIYASEGIADSFTPYGTYENKEVHVISFDADEE